MRLQKVLPFPFATLLFIVVILGATQEGAATQMAGLGIGITLVAIHIFGSNIAGASDLAISKLAELLPTMVDKLTPDGRLRKSGDLLQQAPSFFKCAF
jgi:aquaporin Z